MFPFSKTHREDRPVRRFTDSETEFVSTRSDSQILWQLIKESVITSSLSWIFWHERKAEELSTLGASSHKLTSSSGPTESPSCLFAKEMIAQQSRNVKKSSTSCACVGFWSGQCRNSGSQGHGH